MPRPSQHINPVRSAKDDPGASVPPQAGPLARPPVNNEHNIRERTATDDPGSVPPQVVPQPALVGSEYTAEMTRFREITLDTFIAEMTNPRAKVG